MAYTTAIRKAIKSHSTEHQGVKSRVKAIRRSIGYVRSNNHSKITDLHKTPRMAIKSHSIECQGIKCEVEVIRRSIGYVRSFNGH